MDKIENRVLLALYNFETSGDYNTAREAIISIITEERDDAYRNGRNDAIEDYIF